MERSTRKNVYDWSKNIYLLEKEASSTKLKLRPLGMGKFHYTDNSKNLHVFLKVRGYKNNVVYKKMSILRICREYEIIGYTNNLCFEGTSSMSEFQGMKVRPGKNGL